MYCASGRLQLCAIVSALIAVTSGSANAAPTRATIDQTLATYTKAHPYAEVALGVIDHGRVNVYFVRGVKAKTPLDAATEFQIGSITKLFTATLLAQMVEADEMKLDDPVQQYLPPAVIVPTYKGAPITLLSLANHTSGLPGDAPNLTQQNEAGYSTKMLDDALNATSLTRAPGSKWSYSNFGFEVLGQAISNKAQLSYGDLISQRILHPLGMSETFVTEPASMETMPPAFQYGGAASGAKHSVLPSIQPVRW
jgi:CubicO group peptidase (beta-lactamase class C family)